MRTLLLVFSTFFPVFTFSQLSWETVEVPMSDGYGLAADIYLPDEWTSGPVILVQTPYNKDFYHLIGLPVGTGFDQDASNYAYVIMDWRGFYASSEDLYPDCPTRGEDGYDCVQWIAEQEWCDGNVGTWGPSALGRVQFMTARENPPNLTCMVPLVAGPQYSYPEYYPGGVYRTEYVEQLDQLGFGLSPVILANPYHNLLWTYSESETMYPEDIHVPTLMIGGWYDHNIEVMMDFFSAIQTLSPTDVQDQHRLLFGPWVHGGMGFAQVGSATQGELEYPGAQGWNDSLALAFLDYHMRGIENGWDLTSAVQYFQMGDDVWMQSDTWPPSGPLPYNLYLHPDQHLRNTPSLTFDMLPEFAYDPNDPSPTIGGPTLRGDLDQGPYDQVPLVESRNDILVFSTDILNADVMIQGIVEVHLRVGSTSTDTDFAVRLCDVYPDGRSMLVADGIFRMRFKNGFEESDVTFMEAGDVYDCNINFPNTAITFKEGHRIRIDITSSNYPRFNRNMNTGEEMYPGMDGDALVNPLTATNFIHTSADQQSYIVLPLVGEFPDLVFENTSDADISVYPNPSNDMVMIDPGNWNDPYLLRVFKSDGQLVFEQLVKSGKTRLSSQAWATGIYSITLESGDRHVCKTLVVE